jgi:hypothetical protein
MKDDAVRPLGDEKRHYWLALGMAQTSGVDLQRALEEGRITHGDWAEVVTRCRGCGWTEGCDCWLAAQDGRRPQRSYSPASSTSTVDHVAGREPLEPLVDEKVAVDLRRVGPPRCGRWRMPRRRPRRRGPASAADLGRELRLGDRLRLFHEAVPALFLDLFGHVIGQGVRPRAGDVFVFEASDPVELRLVQPVEQGLELRLGLAGVADDEGRAQGDVGADRAPGPRSRRACVRRRAGAPCAGACRDGRAGTGCRDRAAARPSAISGIRSRTCG